MWHLDCCSMWVGGYMKLLIIYIVLGLVSQTSHAYDMAPFINSEMSKVESQAAISEKAAQSNQHQWQNLHPQETTTLPLKSVDSHLQNLEPIRGSEILGAGLDRPQVGVVKTADPALAIQNELAEKDLYKKTRNNYRKAVQREFVRQAARAGVSTGGRNIAEEIKELEERASTK